MATPHIKASENDFAPTVLMPGDPLRAKFIAEKYLNKTRLINDVRGMLGYTGEYKGKQVSVMGSGMGMPSIGIYSYELYHFYHVETIIRIGSCGAYHENVHVRDLIIAMGASTNSNFAVQYDLSGTFAPLADFNLVAKAKQLAEHKGAVAHIGNILSSDIFYDANPDTWKKWAAMGVLGVEMESAALYMNAAKAGKKALGIFTVSDHFILDEMTTSDEREKTFTSMMEIALELA